MSKSKPVNPDLMPNKNGDPEDYEIDDAVRTLEKAHEIQNNPKLMPHVHKKIGQKHKTLAELKRLAGKKKNEESMSEAQEKTMDKENPAEDALER